MLLRACLTRAETRRQVIKLMKKRKAEEMV
jgi:hypothetical protein